MTKIKATTDVAPEDYHDTVYQVIDGEKPKHKYVQAIKIYGDDDIKEAPERHGLVQTRVLLDLDDPTTEGAEACFSPRDLTRPDIFPTLVRNPTLWRASYETPIPELAVAAWEMVEKNIFNEATAGLGQQFNLEQDANKVLNAIKVMLSGYFGGFVLIQLLGWIKKKLYERIHQLVPPTPVSVDSKLSDIRIHGLKGVFDSRSFNRYYTGASSKSSDEFASLKVLDALSRTFPHRPVALVSLLRNGKIEHQPLFRHDFEMNDTDIFVDSMISVKAVIDLAISMNMEEATDKDIKVVLEFCADKSKYTAKASIDAGKVTVSDVKCEQAGTLSPHPVIETRGTLRDDFLNYFIGSIKDHGLFAHKSHTKSAILPFHVAKSLVAYLMTCDLKYNIQTNSANDTGVELLVLDPSSGKYPRLIGYITDRSMGKGDELDNFAEPSKFSGLDIDAILQGESPVLVLGTNPLTSFAAATKRDEYLSQFIHDSLETNRRVNYTSTIFGVKNIFIATDVLTLKEPIAERKVNVDFSIDLPKGYDFENFRSTAAGTFTSRTPSSIQMALVDGNNVGGAPTIHIIYSFKGADVDLAIELLYTVLQLSITNEESSNVH